MSKAPLTAKVTGLDIGRMAIQRAKQALADAPKRVSRHRGTAGIQEEDGGAEKLNYDGQGNSATLAQIMMMHEFGTDQLPERSWLRTWFDANHDRLLAGMKKAMEDEFQGDKEAVRDWLGVTVDEWRGWIAAGGDFAGLSPQTIARKTAAGLANPDTPLVALRQFVNAFTGKLDGDPT